MPPNPGTPRTFRAIMQGLGLARVRNSPARRIEVAAVQKAQKHAANGDTEASSTSSSPPTSDSKSATTTTHEAGSLANTMETLMAQQHTSLGITEHLRSKGQEAIRLATVKATSVLESTKRGVAQTSTVALGSSSDAAVEGENVLEKLRRAVKETKKNYYSRIPFDERWDGIMSSLALLGRTSTGNAVTPYRDSGEAFLHMWRAVDDARREVLWQTYICKDDVIGQKTIHKLVEAHVQRGCKTELLYDCGGNISGRSRLTEQLKQCGATVIPYRPFFRSFFEYVFKGFDWRISPGLRNHRKILLVDGNIGFCGGLNIGNEYCGPQAGGSGKFRDTHCAVVGPAVAHLREVYDDTKEPRPWKYGWARWRQVATTQLNRSYETGKHVMEQSVWRKLQNTSKEAQRRGGVYFRERLRRAEDNTSRVWERMRWQKQAKQREKCVKLYERQSGGDGDGNGAASPAPARAPAVDEATRDPQGAEAHDATALGEEEAFASHAVAHHDAEGEGDRVGDGKVRNRTGVMRRKVAQARIRALYNATDLPHKRSYTAMLLELPIADSEPVPEAEMYSLRRQSTTQVLSCNPRWHDYSIQYAFWQVTRKCHRRIWITTPYYLPTKKLFWALMHAASRGVDVRILSGSNQTTDPWFMWHASNYITAALLRSGVKIYEYKGSQIMHAKTVVADSVWSSIGSYNWDVMSNKNLEVCLCHLDLGLAREMERQFLQDLAMSQEVRLEEHTQRSYVLRFASWLFYNVVFLLDRITFRSFANQDLEDSADTPKK